MYNYVATVYFVDTYHILSSMLFVYTCVYCEVVSVAYHMICTCHCHLTPLVLTRPPWKVCPISDTWSVCRRRSSHEPRSQTDLESGQSKKF